MGDNSYVFFFLYCKGDNSTFNQLSCFNCVIYYVNSYLFMNGMEMVFLSYLCHHNNEFFH